MFNEAKFLRRTNLLIITHHAEKRVYRKRIQKTVKKGRNTLAVTVRFFNFAPFSSKNKTFKMIIRHIKLCILGIFTLAPITSSAQDLIARQAPIDRKLKIADSVALQRLIERQNHFELQGESVYPEEWNNLFTRNYNVEIPDSFRIDLRGFCMPTPSRRITSNFGYRPAFRRQHEGLDIKVYIGDTIRAAFDGKVRIVKYDRGGYGKYILIRHPNGLETLYGHLSKQIVEEDQEVKAGDPIGLGGNTGRSFGSHLHFETRFLGKPLNPVLMFDFPNQDVTSDFYVFRKDTYREESRMASRNTNSQKNDTEENKPDVGNTFSGHFYKVKAGETLSSISDKLGLTVDQLCQTNRINKKSKIRPGQVLRY